MENAPNPAGGLPAGGGAPAQPQGTPPPAIDAMETLKQKKGWKSNDEVVKFAEEAEKSFSREQNRTNKVKQQLEGAGYTIDDEGNVKPISQPAGIPGYPPQGQPGGYPPQGQPPVEVVYDPYTGQPITDPIALQLIRLPPGHREAVVFNALLEQREKQQTAGYQVEAEVLSKPEAKGFENDVKAVMQQLPLAQRADKKQWEDALLRVKGMRYDQAVKNAGGQAIEGFINKEGIQVPVGTGGEGGGVTLDAEQEQIYRYYQQNHPGMFKDKVHFLRATLPAGGR